MATKHYNSNYIKVFPTSKRGTATNLNIDVQSKFNTEKNLTSLVNRLTDTKCFVIEGFGITGDDSNQNSIAYCLNNITSAGYTIQAGKVNMNGYIFDTSTSTTSSDNIVLYSNDISNASYIYLKVVLEDTSHQGQTFNELSGEDVTNTNKYSGLNVEILNAIPTATAGTYYLQLAYKDTTWHENKLCRVSFNAIRSSIIPTSAYSLSTNECPLPTFLEKYLILDDGELT